MKASKAAMCRGDSHLPCSLIVSCQLSSCVAMDEASPAALVAICCNPVRSVQPQHAFQLGDEHGFDYTFLLQSSGPGWLTEPNNEVLR